MFFVFPGLQVHKTKALRPELIDNSLTWKTFNTGKWHKDPGVTIECSDRDCRVTEWDEWSSCSVSCGHGVKSRKRRVIQQKDGTECPMLNEEVPCIMGACPNTAGQRSKKECIPDNSYGKWSDCTKPCESGTRYRERQNTKCSVRQDSQTGIIAVVAMKHNFKQHEKCNFKACTGGERWSCTDSERGEDGECPVAIPKVSANSKKSYFKGHSQSL